MAKTSKHYLRSGQAYAGPMHKMVDGTLHTGGSHTMASKPLVHFKDLSATAKKRARLKK